MVGIRFSKQASIRLLECIKAGAAIEPPEGVWDVDAMLLVAGLMHFAAMSQGPQTPPEGVEPAELDDQFMKELTAAIEFQSGLHMEVMDSVFDDFGEYDQKFEETVRAGLVVDESGTASVLKFEGFR